MKALLLSILMVAPLFAQGTKAPAKSSTPPVKAAPAAPKAAPASVTTGFVGNKGSKVCHKPDCKMAAKMKEANKTTFGSAAEAQKAGYKACKVCKAF